MNRTQKKCLAFSVGMHLLLLAILIGGAAFAPRPSDQDMTILNIIPANILDHAGVGGGSPNAAPPSAIQPQPVPIPPPAPPSPAPKPPRVEHHSSPAPTVEPRRRESHPHDIARQEPEPTDHGLEPTPKPKRKPHEITPDFTPASSEIRHARRDKEKEKQKEQEKALADRERAEATAKIRQAAIAAAAEARRTREIKNALSALATDVGAHPSDTVIDNPGAGGPSFADYGTVIVSIYYHNWILPSAVFNKGAQTVAKIVVARNGSILSAEIITPCGQSSVDKSVERALRAVNALPAFPTGATDQQRTFFLHFEPSAKEDSG